MNTILASIILLLALAIGLWVVWNVLEIAYRVVMITGCAIVYVILSVWEAITWVIGLLLKPLTGLLKLVGR